MLLCMMQLGKGSTELRNTLSESKCYLGSQECLGSLAYP